MVTKLHSHRINGPVLHIKAVTKTFGRVTVLHDIDIAVQQGEIYGFLGPNGAGKTTTIKLVLDVLRPTSGTIELFGVSNRDTTATHARLGYLSGEMVLDDDLTGLQYLDFVGSTYGGDYRARREELATLLQVDLGIKIGNYSRGNKQKIGLIAALMHQPELLVLDEPSSGFDPLIQDVFIRLMKQYRASGGTVFMSSHTLSEVQRLCDRIAFIRDGRIVGVTNVDELNQTTAKHVQIKASKEVISSIRRQAEPVKGLVFVAASTTKLAYNYSGDMQTLLRLLAGHRLDDVTIREPDLEEVFMTYYQPQASQRPGKETVR